MSEPKTNTPPPGTVLRFCGIPVTTSVALPDGVIMLLSQDGGNGGNGGNGDSSAGYTFHRYDPGTGTWTLSASGEAK